MDTKPPTLRHALDARGIATITLDRPAQLNAFDRAMLVGLLELLRAAATDDATRIVVLRAAGKHFSAGADMGPPESGAGEVQHGGFTDLFEALEEMPKPTIAAVQGACVGGSAALVTCCDVVIATDSAFFSIPQARAGAAPIGVGPALIRSMGFRAYRRYALSGERIAALDAQRLGLADEVCAAADLDARVDQLADAFLHGAPGAQAEIKAYLRQAYPELARLMAAARDYHQRVDTFRTREALDGVAAFKAGRKPPWYRPR